MSQREPSLKLVNSKPSNPPVDLHPAIPYSPYSAAQVPILLSSAVFCLKIRSQH
jgi:hypothetical protein